MLQLHLFAQLKTLVKSCKPGELKQVVNGKTTTLTGFEVELVDTVLFPEGGGQVSAQDKRVVLD